jgi:hypothetical protein
MTAVGIALVERRHIDVRLSGSPACRAVGIALFERRHIDLGRVSSMSCRGC